MRKITIALILLVFVFGGCLNFTGETETNTAKKEFAIIMDRVSKSVR
jgi:hypothetical protein